VALTIFCIAGRRLRTVYGCPARSPRVKRATSEPRKPTLPSWAGTGDVRFSCPAGGFIRMSRLATHAGLIHRFTSRSSSVLCRRALRTPRHRDALPPAIPPKDDQRKLDLNQQVTRPAGRTHSRERGNPFCLSVHSQKGDPPGRPYRGCELSGCLLTYELLSKGNRSRLFFLSGVGRTSPNSAGHCFIYIHKVWRRSSETSALHQR